MRQKEAASFLSRDDEQTMSSGGRHVLPPLDLQRSLEAGEWESPCCCTGKEEAERSWEWWGEERKTSWAANKERQQLQSQHQEYAGEVEFMDNRGDGVMGVD